MVVLSVDGMTCGGCAASVEKIVRKADPGASVSVDLAGKRVAIESSVAASDLAALISAAGFEARPL